MNDIAKKLIEKINKKEVTVAIIGMGYVGLPLAVEFAKEGIHAVGIDVSEHRVGQINRGESYIGDVDGDELKSLVDKGLIRGSLPGGRSGRSRCHLDLCSDTVREVEGSRHLLHRCSNRRSGQALTNRTTDRA